MKPVGTRSEDATRIGRQVLRFLLFRAGAERSAPSTQMAGNGVTWGRPSRRTVDSQNISDSVRTATTSAHDRAEAPGSLKPAWNSAVGSPCAIECSLLSTEDFPGSLNSRSAPAEVAGWRHACTPATARASPTRAGSEVPQPDTPSGVPSAGPTRSETVNAYVASMPTVCAR